MRGGAGVSGYGGENERDGGVSKKPYTVSWFSAGVSSAVATKLIINEIDEIIYTHIDDQHPDTMRFVRDCEAWFGKPITVLTPRISKVEHAMRLYPNSFGGKFAKCTSAIKTATRKEWERDHGDLDLVYAWGMDATESERLDRLRVSMPKQRHQCPLIEQRIGKAEAHEILKASGVKRPAMYDLGYHNNNCVGCVKGGLGYWNKIRVDFPEVFANRAKMEREISASILSTRDTPRKPMYLDELDPQAGRHEGPIVDDCGIMCELQRLD
jgi:hypothetical protein